MYEIRCTMKLVVIRLDDCLTDDHSSVFIWTPLPLLFNGKPFFRCTWQLEQVFTHTHIALVSSPGHAGRESSGPITRSMYEARCIMELGVIQLAGCLTDGHFSVFLNTPMLLLFEGQPFLSGSSSKRFNTHIALVSAF